MDAVNEVAKRPYQRWPNGMSGNPNGRPIGARGQFSEEFMRALRKVFAIEGETAMIRTAKENPTAFTALCGRLLPSESALMIQQIAPRGLDETDLAILRAIREALPEANSRTPSDVLNYVADAIRSREAKVIDAT